MRTLFFILLFQLPIWVAGQKTETMNIERRKIYNDQIESYLNKIGYTIDNDKELDQDIFKFYALNNGEYLVYDDLEFSHIYNSKNEYIEFMSPLKDMPLMYAEPKYKLVLDELFENSERYIDELCLALGIDISNYDTIEDMIKLDDYFSNLDMHLEQYDFDPIRKQLFAYFSRTIANEKKFEDYKFEMDDDGSLNFYFYDKKTNKEYEIYQEFKSMLFKKDEYFSFLSRASFIFTDFRLKLSKQN